MPTAHLVAIENEITERQWVDLRAHTEGWRDLRRLDRQVRVTDSLDGSVRIESEACRLIGRVWTNPMLELGPGGISMHPATAAIWAAVEPRADRGEGPITGWRLLDPALRDAILAAAATRADDAYFARQVGGHRRRDRDFFSPSHAALACFLDAHAGRPLVVVR